VNPRLAFETFVGLEHVPTGSPGMSCTSRDLAAPEVAGGRTAMVRGQLELRRGFVVEARRRFERLAQFQTLTSR
jgi:hypothetical protein